MALTYGFLKCKMVREPSLRASRRKHETQYHLHATADAGGGSWDVAINVGTDDADDLLNYRLVFDFQHDLRDALRAAPVGFSDLTGSRALPALDFVRGDILDQTGPWRKSDVLDGSEMPEPVASLKRLLVRAAGSGAAVAIFGRTYTDGALGIHDVHQNQGSDGGFLNNGQDDHNDHNDIWQDGAVIVDLGDDAWAAYFTAFTQQRVPTDDLGNPMPGSEPLA